MTLRIHLRAEGRTFAACTLSPVIESTRVHGDVTCVRCRALIHTNHHRTRPLPQIKGAS
jgi:hypothetical protein